MDTIVKISQEDNEAVEMLHSRFMGYCDILGYMAQYGSLDTNIFDKKWAEAVELNHKLDKIKREMDIKYHPQDDNEYKNFTFNFIKAEMIYST